MSAFTLPDVAGMSTTEAAHAYVAAGLVIGSVPPPGTVQTRQGTNGGKESFDWDANPFRTVEDLAQWPGDEHGIALPMRENGLLAVDLDDFERGAETVELLDSLPSARQVTGKGFHAVYAADDVYGQSDAGFPGANIRSKGYVVAAPSVHPSGHVYRWESREVAPLPTAIAERLRTGSTIAAEHVSPAQRDAFLDACNGALTPAKLDAKAEYLQGLLDSGEGRNNALIAVLPSALREAARGEYPAQQAIDSLAGAALAAGLPDDEVSVLVDRALSYALQEVEASTGPAFVWANDPAYIAAMFADPHALIRMGRRREVTAEAVIERIGGNPFLDALLTVDDLANLPEPEPLIADTLDRRTEALLVGEPGTGKSFVALDWSACIASGTPWHGREVRQGTVVYIAAEGVFGIRQRLMAWEAHYGRKIGPGLRLYRKPAQFTDAAMRALIGDAVQKLGASLVVVDTLARSAVGVEENSATEMSQWLSAVSAATKDAGDEHGTSVLLVHHTPKSGRGPRGSGALLGAMDTVYELGEHGDGIKLERTKRKDGPREDRHTLRFEEVASSVVLVAADAEVAESATAKASRAASQIRGYLLNHSGATKGDIRSSVDAGIGRPTADAALAQLVRYGDVQVTEGARRSQLHSLTDKARERIAAERERAEASEYDGITKASFGAA